MDITFLLVQSERCFRMARECADPQIAAQLEEMSREFEEKADEYGTRMARELLHPSPQRDIAYPIPAARAFASKPRRMS